MPGSAPSRASLVVAAIAALVASSPAAPSSTTFAAAGRQAVSTLLGTYYAGNGLWRECDAPGCAQTDTDWGADSLTDALAFRARTGGEAAIAPALTALAAAAPTYPAPCELPSCQSWSDQPLWDAIADTRVYQATGDAEALAKAEAAFGFVEGGDAYALGACPDVRYQQPSGSANHLKTAETDANAIEAALLLYQATGVQAYLDSAVSRYGAVRARFLDPAVPLYTVYLFDDGHACTPVPHRFFASVNGDMIWSGVALAQLTGNATYLGQAIATAKAVAAHLSDPAGIFADLQAENDLVEPLVEGMYSLATEAGQTFARAWILTNAAAALATRTPDGSFGRFFDGPPPAGTVTAWQATGGLALELAAAALDPSRTTSRANPWARARRTNRQLGPGGTIRFTGSELALIGTIGEPCCEAGHARVFVDGHETFDGTGIWQGKSSLGRPLPGTVLFAWRWPGRGTHTIRFAPGLANAKEGGSFLHIRAYLTG